VKTAASGDELVLQQQARVWSLMAKRWSLGTPVTLLAEYRSIRLEKPMFKGRKSSNSYGKSCAA